MTKTMTTAWQDDLRTLGACREAVTFAEGFPAFAEAWTACARGDWMLWFVGRTIARAQGPERKRLVRVGCQCARLALPFVRAGETRPLRAIEMAERWANGDETVTLAEVSAAASASAAAAAAYAAYAAAAAERASILKQCADLVRVEYPTPPLKVKE